MPLIIDGKQCAAKLYETIAEKIKTFQQEYNQQPKLVVVIVGEDAASQTYVAAKKKKALALGMSSEIIALPEQITKEKLLAEVARLNEDEAVNGILIQLPLPAHLKADDIIAAIDPKKDVDGLTPHNAGRLVLGLPALVPCTPLGCMRLIKTVKENLSGMHAVVVGRSILVGKPLGALLLQENCTLTMAHSKTKDLPALARNADILIAAAGQKRLVKKEWVNPSAIVIDVGIHREVIEGKNKLCGDVDFDDVAPHVAAITPVPGGVGPMTVACLMENTLRAALWQRGTRGAA